MRTSLTLLCVATLFAPEAAAATLESTWTTAAVGADEHSVAVVHAKLRRALGNGGAKLFDAALPPRNAESAELESILRAVSDAYYRDELGGMDTLFNSADAILATQAIPDRQRVQTHLWRAAVFLSRGDEERAGDALGWALAIAGPVKIDTQTFRPSFARFVREFIEHRGELHRVELEVFPPNAVLLRKARRLSTEQYFGSAGPHRLELRAAKMKAIDIELELPTASPVELALTSLSAAAVLERSAPPSESDLAAIRGPATCIVALQVHAEATVAYQSCEQSSMRTKRFDGANAESIAGWALAADSPSVTGTWQLEAAALVSDYRLTVRDAQSRSVDNRFVGAGVRIGGERVFLQRGWAYLRGELTSYALGSDPAALPNGQSVEVRGGFMARGRGGIGFNLGFGDRVRVRPAIGALFETFVAEDFFEDGERTGRFTSTSMLAFETHLDTAFELVASDSGGLSLELNAALVPFGSLNEEPAARRGTDPALRLSGSAEAMAVWRIDSSWDLALGYRAELRRWQATGSLSPIYDLGTDPSSERLENSAQIRVGVHL